MGRDWDYPGELGTMGMEIWVPPRGNGHHGDGGLGPTRRALIWGCHR